MKKIYFYIMFLILFAISFCLLKSEKDLKISQHLEITKKKYLQSYNVIYNEYKKLSTVIFTTQINTPEVIEIFKDAKTASYESKREIRKRLYNKLSKTYKILQDYNIKQLHFHLPNNESFLRFHRPAKFGDNLTNVRSTVEFVNETYNSIDGFEEGRIYNGYRFVFPLFNESEHIGSVEVSFSTLAMNNEFMKNFEVLSNFLIAKNVVNKKVFVKEKSNYIKSKFDDFYFEKKIYEQKHRVNGIMKDHLVSDETIQILKKRAFDDNSFSLYDSKSKDIITFLKVKNPITKKVVGIFIVRSSATYIFNKTRNFYLILTGMTLLIAISLAFVYRILNQQKILKKMVEEKTSNLSKLNRELEESEDELRILNENLEYRIKEEVFKNRQKDKILFEHTKMAAMGEMIGNIAHQWRQPLSAIATAASSIKLQKELDILDDNFLNENMDGIVNNTQYLSKTIDDFRNFIRGNSKKELFNLKDSVNSFMSLVSSTLKQHSIDMQIDIADDIVVNGLKNELNQCFLNLFNNSKDAICKNGECKFIAISAFTQNNSLIINFKDNGGGIDENILDKVFEPYFTTKHQSQGTGLGLNMTYRLIVESMGGIISVMNNSFDYKGIEYHGAEFEIILPLIID